MCTVENPLLQGSEIHLKLALTLTNEKSLRQWKFGFRHGWIGVLSRQSLSPLWGSLLRQPLING